MNFPEKQIFASSHGHTSSDRLPCQLLIGRYSPFTFSVRHTVLPHTLIQYNMKFKSDFCDSFSLLVIALRFAQLSI